MTFDPRRLLLPFEEHSSQQDASDRLQKKQEKVPDPISVRGRNQARLLQDTGSAQSEIERTIALATTFAQVLKELPSDENWEH
jgi:hypothetical protein